MKLSYVLVVLLVFGACDPAYRKDRKKEKSAKVTNGIIKTHYKDGSIQNEISYKDGKRDGLSKSYHKNGKIHLEIPYHNDVKHGISKRYYETGIQYSETPYDSGKIHGVLKKFRENGKLMAEIPYREGNECMGLKEYLLDGKLRGDYPKIVIRTDNKLLSEGAYYLRISMSEKVKNVEYFTGSLKQGCLTDNLDPIRRDGRTQGVIEYNLMPGGFIMEKVNVIAKVETILGNTYVAQREFNVAVDFPSFR